MQHKSSLAALLAISALATGCAGTAWVVDFAPSIVIRGVPLGTPLRFVWTGCGHEGKVTECSPQQLEVAGAVAANRGEKINPELTGITFTPSK